MVKWLITRHVNGNESGNTDMQMRWFVPAGKSAAEGKQAACALNISSSDVKGITLPSKHVH